MAVIPAPELRRYPVVRGIAPLRIALRDIEFIGPWALLSGEQRGQGLEKEAAITHPTQTKKLLVPRTSHDSARGLWLAHAHLVLQ